MNNLIQAYQASKYKDIVKDYNGLPFPFDVNWENVSVAMSGGADSALLTYIICDIITKHHIDCTVHVLYNIRCWKSRPWQEDVANQVFDSITRMFPSVRFERHTNFVPPEFEHGDKDPYIVDEYGKINSGDTIELRAFAEYIGHKHNIDAYFNAVTKNPPVPLKGMLEKRNIELNEDTFYLMIRDFDSQIVCHPFRFVSKDWIISQYFENNITDLLNITRSCEGEFPSITHKTYRPGQYVPLCHNCFWCKERDWAFNENIQRQHTSRFNGKG